VNQDDPEKRIVELEHQLAEQRRSADLRPAQPGLLLSWREKILLGISLFLDVAGFAMVAIAVNLVNPVPLSIVAAALIGLSSVIQVRLVIAMVRRQSNRRHAR
jgi:hypothetical protein